MKKLRPHLDEIGKIKKELAKGNAKAMNIMISGSHLYGFESENSDTDYRGTFLGDTRKLLGLNKPKEVIEIKNVEDAVMFEISKEINLAMKGNCNALERIQAEQLMTTKEFIKLRDLVKNVWGKNGVYNSYKGMAKSNYKKFILQGRSTVKKYLYIFRSLMAGIYSLRTGSIKPNINKLNNHFKNDMVEKLIEMKKSGKEKDRLPSDMDNGEIEEEIGRLFDEIDEAYKESDIPEKPDEERIKKINDEIIKFRLEHVDS